MMKECDSIWVTVVRMTKSTHFSLIKISFTLLKLDELYIEKIVNLHGISSSIMSDRDPRFTLIFWESLHKALSTKLRLSFSYHLQTDGQT